MYSGLIELDTLILDNTIHYRGEHEYEEVSNMSIGEIDHLIGGHRCLLRHLNKLPQAYAVLNKLGKCSGKKVNNGK